jgi:hypothetical protein
MNERKKGYYCRYMRSLSLVGGGGVDGVHQELMAAKFTVCVCVGLCYIRSIIFGVTKVLFIQNMFFFGEKLTRC